VLARGRSGSGGWDVRSRARRAAGAGSRIFAVESRCSRARGTRALGEGKRGECDSSGRRLHGPFELPGLVETMLDGMIFANALHFVRDADIVLARLASRVRPGGRVVFVEYDRRASSRWVPYPIPADRLPALAASAGLSAPVITATRPSAFGGNLYGRGGSGREGRALASPDCGRDASDRSLGYLPANSSRRAGATRVPSVSMAFMSFA